MKKSLFVLLFSAIWVAGAQPRPIPKVKMALGNKPTPPPLVPTPPPQHPV